MGPIRLLPFYIETMALEDLNLWMSVLQGYTAALPGGRITTTTVIPICSCWGARRMVFIQSSCTEMIAMIPSLRSIRHLFRSRLEMQPGLTMNNDGDLDVVISGSW